MSSEYINVNNGDDSSDSRKRGFCSRMAERCTCLAGRYRSPTTYFNQDSIVGTYILEFRRRPPSFESDWTVGVTDKLVLHVFKRIDQSTAWLSILPLPEALANDEVGLSFKNNFRRVEVTLRKPIPTTVWAKQTHGLKDYGKFVGIHEGHSMFDAYIMTKKCLTSNVLLFGIQIVNSAHIGVPTGFHVTLHNGDVSRPYSPVCQSVMEPLDGHKSPVEETQSMTTILYFMIKIYPNGEFTQLLDAIELDDGTETATLKVSTPHGYFDHNMLNNFSELFLVAGGSGLSPMIKIIREFWELKDKMRGKRIALLFFCSQFYDIIWYREFLRLQESVNWFHYFPVLTRPTERCNWKGLTGRITEELVQSCINEMFVEKRGIRKACICGPPGFNSASVSAFSGKVLPENLFVFYN